jgi:hypothetical protein
MSADIAPEEAEAIRLLWEKQGGHGAVPQSEEQRLLLQIRERVALIESHVVQDMLGGRLREGRRYPRRHQQAALVVLILALGATAIIAGIVSLFR